MAQRTKTVNPATQRDRLVEMLTAKMATDPESAKPPIVVTNRMSATRSAHVLVIWDKWKDYTLAERGAMIMDACAAAQPHARTKVTIALGLTSLEALRQGYLPYRIVPVARAEDGIPRNRILDAMGSVGGVLLRADDESQLRFPTKRQAEDAYRNLFNLVPLPVWALVEEVSRIESA